MDYIRRNRWVYCPKVAKEQVLDADAAEVEPVQPFDLVIAGEQVRSDAVQ
jgi:hypothetical protein